MRPAAACQAGMLKAGMLKAGTLIGRKAAAGQRPSAPTTNILHALWESKTQPEMLIIL